MTAQMEPPLNPDSKIIIVGAGVFGLSTALHLLRRGYTNVHLFDKQPFHQNHYATPEATGASCDENKILRALYGGRKLYQDRAFHAMPAWREWNTQLARSSPADLPPTLSPEIPLWNNCGFLRLSSRDGHLEQSEIDTQKNFPEDIQHTQYRVSDPKRRHDAVGHGVPEAKLDPFHRRSRNLPFDGILDMTAGFVLASRACTWALHLVRQAGAQIHFGTDHALIYVMKIKTRFTGIVTASYEKHEADLIVLTCGGWTPALLPYVEKLLETTAGTVFSFQLPPCSDRRDLWEKYAPENFPVWSWNMGGYDPEDDHDANDGGGGGGGGGGKMGGIYGLPRTPEGVVKIAFRGAKWTNYAHRSQGTGQRISFPDTELEMVPEEAMRVLRAFCEENLPDFAALELQRTRLCWYTDSVDDSFLIARVPEMDGLIVASGGSGHGFKFLPVLGEHVVDVIEGKDTEYTRLFSWRPVPEGKRNGLEEGQEGWRTLDRQKLVGASKWKEIRHKENGSKL